jgi:hypothetical protein
MRTGTKMGNNILQDGLIKDGLTDPFTSIHMVGIKRELILLGLMWRIMR